MAIEGSLEHVGIADICQLLAMGRKTGCLSVTDRSNFGYIYFDGGRVTYASVLNRPDRLGELLVRNGVITREQLSDAMERQAHQPGRRLGEILVDVGTISRDELARYIQVQVEEAVYHLFTWERGTFHFDPDQVPEEEGLLIVSINAENLLLEGARRVDEWSLIEKKIPSLGHIFATLREPREEEVELTETQKRVLPLLDGTHSVQEIVEETGLVEFDAAKAIFGLIQAGFVEPLGTKEGEGNEDESKRARHHLSIAEAFYRRAMWEDAEQELRRALEIDPALVRARFRLGVLRLRRGRAEAALEAFDGLPEQEQERFAVLRNRALALEHLGRYQEAIELLDRAAVRRPGHPLLLLARAITLTKAHRGDEARATFRSFRERWGQNRPPPIFYAYGILAHGMAGDREGAVELAREGTDMHPDEAALLVNAAAALVWAGESEEAETLLRDAISDGKGAPAQAYKALGDLLYQRGEQTAAQAQYERAVKVLPTLGDDVYFKLGTIAHREGDRDWALLLWRRALHLHPENEAVRTQLELLGSGS